MDRANPLLVVALAATLFSASACAPRVSLRSRSPAGSDAPAAVTASYAAPVRTELTPTAHAVPAPEAPLPQASTPASTPAAMAPTPPDPYAPAATPRPASSDARDDDGFQSFEDLPEAPERVVRPRSSPVRDNFYAYTDAEIATLRKRSRSFRQVHNRLKKCTQQGERKIAQRENIRQEIIRLYNVEETPSAKTKEKIAKLQAKERRLKEDQSVDFERCQATEEQATQMLRSSFERSSPSGARP